MSKVKTLERLYLTHVPSMRQQTRLAHAGRDLWVWDWQPNQSQTLKLLFPEKPWRLQKSLQGYSGVCEWKLSVMLSFHSQILRCLAASELGWFLGSMGCTTPRTTPTKLKSVPPLSKAEVPDKGFVDILNACPLLLSGPFNYLDAHDAT